MNRFVYGIALPLFVVLLGLFGVETFRFYHGPPPPGATPRRVEIARGAGFSEVCRTMKEEGILGDARWFYLVGRVGGAERSIRAGSYRLAPGIRGGRLLRILRRGPNDVVRVTVPEGLRIGEVASILAGALRLDEAAFAGAARSGELAARLGLPGPTLEGYLFPETYDFYWSESPERIAARMVARFREVFGAEEISRADRLGLSVHEVLTLASIIEAETSVPDERPRISAVFHNRLRIGMPLQADPTVQYALGTRRRLLQEDMDAHSPYNTYRVRGLPPGPICSPGAASIRAALYPAEGSNDIYFVASGVEGRHIFSATREAHDRAKRRTRERGLSP